MYRQVLESIQGIGIYPVISLVIFIVFFSIVITWILRIDKTYLKRMQQMPFEKSEFIKTFTGDNHEKK